MKDDLYKKYLRNIKNGKIAIKKEYVKKGYFDYYSKTDIINFSNSKKIIIDGFNGFYEEFVYEVFNKLKDNKPLDYKTIFLGKVGPKLNKIMHNANQDETNVENYNFSISDFDLQHIYINHYLNNERNRGQRTIQKRDIELIPSLIINTKEVSFLGKNRNGSNLYKFISYNKDGTYNLIEFVGNTKKQLGLKTMYINLKKVHP